MSDKFEFKIIVTSQLIPSDIYLMSPASKEEIESGNYLEVNGYKISANPKKHGVIKELEHG